MATRTIAGSRAIVTGASSGIGRAIALELGRHGADVVLLARRADRLGELAAEFQSLPGRAELVAGDVVDPAVRRSCIDRAIDAFGGLDILVNNAGLSAIGRFQSADSDRLRRIMEVNFFAPAELIRAALPTLKQGRKPIVVNVGSILGRRGIPHSSEYCASKFALRGLSQSLRAELAPQGIDLLVVSPGTTQTELFEHAIEIRTRPPWLDRRGVSPERVAQATVRAIERGKSEIVPSFSGKALCWLERLCPWLLDWRLSRHG
jgi:short-subunit dehydrogenase